MSTAMIEVLNLLNSSSFDLSIYVDTPPRSATPPYVIAYILDDDKQAETLCERDKDSGILHLQFTLLTPQEPGNAYVKMNELVLITEDIIGVMTNYSILINKTSNVKSIDSGKDNIFSNIFKSKLSWNKEN